MIITALRFMQFRRLGLKLAFVALLALPGLAQAQFFQYNPQGDVLAGFRKTGTSAGNFQMVANLGNITNFLSVPAGASITITNFTAGQLTDAFTNFNNLQWSVFSTFPINTSGRQVIPWTNTVGIFPGGTLWFTLPGTNVATQSQPPVRQSVTQQTSPNNLMYSVGGIGAFQISSGLSQSVDNTNTELREPVSFSQYILSAYIADSLVVSNADFASQGASPLPNNEDVENNTGTSFSSAQRSDFYQVCPSGTTDPLNGSTTSPYFTGSFVLNPNGSMTFTRAFSITPSVASGSAPLTVAFTNTASSTGGITNWVWNFGNGTSITNTTGRNATNTYAVAGTYFVTLTVFGPAGFGSTSTSVVVVVGSKPSLGITLSGAQFIINGTNAPASQQYRLFSTTNVSTQVSTWTPIYTNTTLSNGTFLYTNKVGGTNTYFIMLTP